MVAEAQKLTRKRGARGLLLAALALTMLGVGMRYLWGIHTAFDLNAADEGMYMHRALLWWLKGQPIPMEWGPVYHAWLAWLARRSNPVIAFYLTLYATALVPPALLALLVYRHTRQAFWSLLTGVAFLVSWGNHGDWRVNHFLAAGVLAVLLLVPERLRPRDRLTWLTVQMWAAWGLAYIRPEMFLAAVLFMGWEAGMLWRTRRTMSGQRVWQVNAVLLALFLGVAWMTNPWRNPSGRMLVAFGQHFAVRWEARTGAHLDPYHRWYDVLQQEFGPVHSVSEAATARPDLFVWFVSRNVRGWFLVVAQRLAPWPWKAHWVWGAAAIAVLALAAGWLFWRKQRAEAQAAAKTAWLWWLGVMLVWALPAVASSWLFYPRPHYQAVPLVLGWAALGCILAAVWPLPKGRDGALAVLLVVMMLTVFPQPYRFQGEQPRLKTVLLLRRVAETHPRPEVWTTDPGYMGFFYTVDVLDVHAVDASSLPEARPASLPAMWYPWPFAAAIMQQRPWLTALAEAPQREGFQPCVLPDGSRWLSREGWLCGP